jgi:hypothetical protein
MTLTPRQRCFFADFGYLVLPGLMAGSIEWITEEFERTFRDAGIVHHGTQRTSLGQFMDRNERLCALLDDPRINGALTGLLGEDFNYLGSGGEYYVGGGLWHPDCGPRPMLVVKLAMYLDPLTRQTGALRLVPSSHLQRKQGNLDTQELWGVGPEEMPCVAPDNQPGDVIIFNQNTFHNSLRGGNRRRMFNMNGCAHCRTPEQLAELDRMVAPAKGQMYGEVLRRTATPQRLRHLQQVLEREALLAA